MQVFASDGLLFQVFAEIDPVTKVPKKGAWIMCVVVCFICFFLDLEAMTTIISLGNLLSYSLVNLVVVVLRMRKPNVEGEPNYSSDEKYAWAYFVSAFAFTIALV